MKIFLKIIGGIAVLILLLALYVQVAGNKTFDAPYPDIRASTDSAVIARGEYLVFGPAHCATCHVPMDQMLAVENGLKVPLSGGWEVEVPPVILRAPNLTPDEETGIGKRTDGELARTLRHGIAHNGAYILPVMPYSQMSDEDLTAIISYLRSQPPVKNPVEHTKYTFLGKALLAFGVLKPKPADTPPVAVPKDDVLAYGGYLAKDVANCMGCHTAMDMMTGEFTVPLFSGGFYFEPDAFSQGYSFVSPNLTPHPETGIMTSWTEDAFVSRFKNGRLHQGTPMAWGAFSRMDTFDLQAIYRYLRTLEPVEHFVGQTVFEPGENYMAKSGK